MTSSTHHLAMKTGSRDRRQALAIGVASILVMGGMLLLPSAAQADQFGGDCCPSAPRLYAGLDIDDIVAQRKVEMAQALIDPR